MCCTFGARDPEREHRQEDEDTMRTRGITIFAGAILCVLAAGPAMGQQQGSEKHPAPPDRATTPPGGTTDVDAPSSRKSRSPEFDSNQQRQQSLQADRDRKSGAMNPYRGRPDGIPQPDDAASRQPTGRAADDPAATNDKGTGMTSARIRQLQAVLKGQGHDPGPIDGVMGARTQDALRAFQSAQQLESTGEADGETLEKLGIGDRDGR
jgi:peptidoglycan hydrolase-like protein with peptidoglycan-binding domain